MIFYLLQLKIYACKKIYLCVCQDGSKELTVGQDMLDLITLDDSSHVKKAEAALFRDQPLERCYDTLCDNQSFKVIYCLLYLLYGYICNIDFMYSVFHLQFLEQTDDFIIIFVKKCCANWYTRTCPTTTYLFSIM